MPTKKMTAVGAAGMASILVVWVLGEFGVVMPGEVASALTGLLAFGAGWMRREG